MKTRAVTKCDLIPPASTLSILYTDGHTDTQTDRLIIVYPRKTFLWGGIIRHVFAKRDMDDSLHRCMSSPLVLDLNENGCLMHNLINVYQVKYRATIFIKMERQWLPHNSCLIKSSLSKNQLHDGVNWSFDI